VKILFTVLSCLISLNALIITFSYLISKAPRNIKKAFFHDVSYDHSKNEKDWKYYAHMSSRCIYYTCTSFPIVFYTGYALIAIASIKEPFLAGILLIDLIKENL
jgi:hypothetical protein